MKILNDLLLMINVYSFEKEYTYLNSFFQPTDIMVEGN